jgi:hypothetical protein
MGEQESLQKAQFRRKRATDLMLPPEPGHHAEEMHVAREDRLSAIQEMGRTNVTGCIRTSNEKTESRGAILLYRGRVVGAVYTSKLMPETQPTEASYKLVLADAGSPATKIERYTLPDSRVLPMATMFLGKVVTRSDQMTTRDYLDHMLGLLAQEHQTSCMPVALKTTGGTCLVFVNHGLFSGAFYMDTHTVTADLNFVYKLIDADPVATIHACVFPAEVNPVDPQIGYSLG